MSSSASSTPLRLVETARDVRLIKSSWTPSHLTMIKKLLTIVPQRVKGYSFGPPPTLRAFRETNWELIVPRAWAHDCMSRGQFEMDQPDRKKSKSVAAQASQRRPVSAAAETVSRAPLRCPSEPCHSTRANDLKKVRTWAPDVGAFAFELRDFQVDITRDALEKLTSAPHSVLLEIGCGRGKTIMALYLAHRLRVQTLVLVQDSFLLNQWVERIQACLPSVRVGRLQQDRNELGEDADIVIGMVQTVVARYQSMTDVFQSVGLLILDECHRMASPLFSQVVQTCMAPYVVGCSATPERQDGLHELLNWYIGPHITSVGTDVVPVQVVRNTFPAGQYVQVQCNAQGLPNVVQLMTDLTKVRERHQLLLGWIRAALSTDRVLIVLSHRRDQLQQLFTDLTTSGDAIDVLSMCAPSTGRASSKKRSTSSTAATAAIASVSSTTTTTYVGFYVGGMKQDLLDLTANHARVILATYQMAQQALDIPRLNTLVMGTPMKDMRQSIGRITRLSGHSDTVPVVIDIMDMGIPTCVRHGAMRSKLYRQRDYQVVTTRGPSVDLLTSASSVSSSSVSTGDDLDDELDAEIEDEDEDEDEQEENSSMSCVFLPQNENSHK